MIDQFQGHRFDSHRPQAELLKCVAQLPGGRLLLGDNHIVPIEDGKWFVSHKALGTVNRVAQALGLLLAQVLDIAKVGDIHHLVVQVGFA